MSAEAANAILALLALRGPGKTICPSEAARRLSPHDWRARMPIVHAAAARLERDGLVAASWRSTAVTLHSGCDASPGPYRLRRVDPDVGAPHQPATSDAC